MKNIKDLNQMIEIINQKETHEEKINEFKNLLDELLENINTLSISLNDATYKDKAIFLENEYLLIIQYSGLEYIYKTIILNQYNQTSQLNNSNDIKDKILKLKELLNKIEKNLKQLKQDIQTHFDDIEDFTKVENEYDEYEKLYKTIIKANDIELKGIALIEEKVLKYLKTFEDNLAIPKNLENVKYYVFLLKINNYNYCLPISYKEYITKDGKTEGVTFKNIYDKDNKHILTLKFNNMFPTPKYKMVDTNKEENEKLKNILEYVVLDFEVLSKKILKIYKIGKKEITVNENLLKLINNFNIIEGMSSLYKESSKAVDFVKNVFKNIKKNFNK